MQLVPTPLPLPSCADPTSYFEQFPEADILASSDQLMPTTKPGDTGLEDPHAIHSALNIGGPPEKQCTVPFGGHPLVALCLRFGT